MIDSRAIDTFIILFLEGKILNKITFADHSLLTENVRKILNGNGSISTNVFTPSISYSENLIIDSTANTIIFLFENSGYEDYEEIQFFGFPNLSNTRYILNTNNSLYAKSLQFYSPAKTLHLLQRYVFKTALWLGISKTNIVVKVPSNQEALLSMLRCHLYTGVPDGKRSIIKMFFNKNGEYYFKKIAASNISNAFIKKEYKTVKEVIEPIDPNGLNIPHYFNFNTNTYNSFEMKPKRYSRPFIYKIDKTKLFEFLDKLQNDRKKMYPLKNFDFSQVKDKFLLKVYNYYKTSGVQCANSHGDLSPWNFYIAKSGLYIFDFETVSNYKPLSYDFIKLQLFYLNPSQSERFLKALTGKVMEYVDNLHIKLSKIQIQENINVSLLIYLIELSDLYNMEAKNNIRILEYNNIRKILQDSFTLNCINK